VGQSVYVTHGHRRHAGAHEPHHDSSHAHRRRTVAGTRRPGQARWVDRLRYRFDSGLSRSPWVLAAWLGILTLSIVLVATLAIVVFDLGIEHGEPAGFLESFWQAMLRVLEPTSLAEDRGWPLRLISLLVTLSGIFVATALIGLIAASLDQRIASLRKGRSVVLESGHVLVLGWSARLFSVVTELVEANRNRRGAVIVVLAQQDKTHMEDELRSRIGDAGGTRIICRTGDPANGSDLELVNDTGARAILVLADESTDGDAATVPAALTVLHRDPSRSNLVVEIRDPRTARDLIVATAGRAATVEPHDVIAKIASQACYQAGLGAVYEELLDFAGDELYFTSAAPLAGRTFGDAVLACERSSVVGLMTADGEVTLAPPPTSVVDGGDQIVAISPDDDTLVFDRTPTVETPVRPASARTAAAAARLLVVGWSALGARVLAELERFPDRPEVVDVLVDDALTAPGSAVGGSSDWTSLRFIRSTDERSQLAAMLAEGGYDHVLVLGYRDRLAPAHADAHTLLTLATIRHALPAAVAQPRIVAEVVEVRNVEIAEAVGADDLVVSDRLCSLLMAQLAEAPRIRGVFAELFDPDGSSIELRSAQPFAGGPTTYGAVVAAGLDWGEVVIGYRLASGQVTINPAKSTPVTLSAADQVIAVVSAGHGGPPAQVADTRVGGSSPRR
jgi:voltage-gated potassium channel Kch